MGADSRARPMTLGHRLLVLAERQERDARGMNARSARHTECLTVAGVASTTRTRMIQQHPDPISIRSTTRPSGLRSGFDLFECDQVNAVGNDPTGGAEHSAGSNCTLLSTA